MKKNFPHFSSFLEKFIKEERYLQNTPLKTNEFIKLCEKRNFRISEQELEFLEKEKLLFPVFRIALPKIIEKGGKKLSKPFDYVLKPGERFCQYFPLWFQSGRNSEFKEWINKGILYDPSQRPFQGWALFKADKSELSFEKIVSFYSTFQIHWLATIREYWPPKFSSYQEEINVIDARMIEKNGKLYLNANLEIKKAEKKDKFFGAINKYKINLENDFECRFTWQTVKEGLIQKKKDMDMLLRFLLSIQHVYYPYAKFGGKKIHILGADQDEWNEKKYGFDPRKELQTLNLTIQQVAGWYKNFAKEAIYYLGGARGNWLQLLKNIAWDEKDDLEGSVSLGIDYLQWALMLKEFIEDHEKKEILDVDEISVAQAEEILKIDCKTIEKQWSARTYRNRYYYDPIEQKNYYHDISKRFYYLVNDLGIDYQPRIIVFVEGKTEKVVLSKFMKKWYGIEPEFLGIEFMDLEGVDKIISTAETANQLKNCINRIEQQLKTAKIDKKIRRQLNESINTLKKTKVVINNFQSFINYNLEKWQIVPFFVADNEGEIKKILEIGKLIKFQGKFYDVPNPWKFIWGISHTVKPFTGQSFEFANFSNREIAQVLSKILKKRISLERVKKARLKGLGIKQIDLSVNSKKIKIADALLSDLFKKHRKYKDKSISKRPIFELMKRITDLSVFNHLPVNRKIELTNKEFIKKQLNPNYKEREIYKTI